MRSRLERVRAAIGITRVGATTSLDVLGIHTATAVRAGVVQPAVSVASGKGDSPEEAELAAIAEAYERFCAEPRGRLKLVRARAGDLPRRVDPSALVPAYWSRYGPAQPIEWCSGVALDDGRACAVPANAVFFPYEPPAPEQLFAAHTTGLACGGAHEDALSAALLECIERDHYSRVVAELSAGREVARRDLDPSQLNVDTADDAARLRRAGASLILRDITGDFAVPTVLAVITHDGQVHRGCAAHLQLEVAARAALLEAAQSRATDIQGAREDLVEPDGVRAHSWFTEPGATITPRAAAFVCDDVGAEVRFLAERVREVVGAAALAVDLSFDAELPAVRVIVPRLELWSEDEDRVGPRCRQWLGDA